MEWRWQVPGESPSEVRLDYSLLSGGKQLTVDGTPVAGSKASIAVRWRRDFELHGRAATVVVRLRGLIAPDAALTVDGEEVEPTVAPNDVPVWAWGFVAANLAILVIALGGAVPGALAGVGAVSCVGLARAQRSTTWRLVGCAAVTAAMWGTYALLVAALRP